MVILIFIYVQFNSKEITEPVNEAIPRVISSGKIDTFIHDLRLLEGENVPKVKQKICVLPGT